MRVDVLTLFPEAFDGPLDVSIIKRAREDGLLDLHLHNPREYATDRHKSVDDYPFGGGQGMVLRVDVLDRALSHVQREASTPGYVVFLSPQGERLSDNLVRRLAKHERLVLVCGRYEGVDERFVEHCVDKEVSIGDYVLTGGELPAMVLIDAVARHIPGALGDAQSPEEESFVGSLLEHGQYTRPVEYRGWTPPDVLLGGDHAKIKAWKAAQRIGRTMARRPDLLPEGPPPPARKRKPRPHNAAIRSYVHRSDYDRVVSLWRACEPGIQLGPADSALEIARMAERDPELFVVAERAQEIAGAVMGGFDGRQGYVYHLVVEPGTRGSGLAELLLDELERRFAQTGCLRMNLMVSRDNWPALRFFRREGWSESAVRVFVKDLPLAHAQSERQD
jgi:tRNA (guanine37-N1)-methyltransferase